MDNTKQDNVSMLRALGVYNEVLEDFKYYPTYSRDFLLTWNNSSGCIISFLRHSTFVGKYRRNLYEKAFNEMVKILRYE